jgi:hypothetical protein
LLAFPSAPDASGLFRGLPEPVFRVDVVAEAAAAESPVSDPFATAKRFATDGVGGDVRTESRNCRTSSMMHLGFDFFVNIHFGRKLFGLIVILKFWTNFHRKNP